MALLIFRKRLVWKIRFIRKTYVDELFYFTFEDINIVKFHNLRRYYSVSGCCSILFAKQGAVLYLAVGPGLEPEYTAPKAAVLPLDDPTILCFG